MMQTKRAEEEEAHEGNMNRVGRLELVIKSEGKGKKGTLKGRSRTKVYKVILKVSEIQ